MSIRLRLALWYGALFGLVLLVVLLLTYAFHARAHYDDLDRALVTSAAHAAEGMPSPSVTPFEASGGLEVVIRFFGPDGKPRPDRSPAGPVPVVDPQAILATPAGPAFDPIAGLAPALGPAPPAAGAFGLATTPAGRWRVFVLPLGQPSGGVVAVLAPLERLDASIRLFRFVPVGLGLAGLAAALLGGWAIASRALRPVAAMIATADAIGETRDPSRRIAVPPHRDELHALAETFNRMLAGLEAAYRAQQRFVADASHELRAPLTAIQGNVQLLRRHAAMPAAEQEAALAETEREAMRLTQLVADLLVLARADAGAPLRRQPVELDRVLLEVVAQARHFGHGQGIAVEVLEPVIVLGDPDRLKQLLLIGVDNAVKYTPPDGQVTAGLRRDGDMAMVTMRDTGIGISATDLPHVFERFWRADPARTREPGGTGLGLPIARWIVEGHGGRIALTSEVGQGTTLSIRLPLAD